MIASLASSLLAMLCAACSTPSDNPQATRASVAQVESPQSFGAAADLRSSELHLPLDVSGGYRASAWPDQQTAARITALDLATPTPIRTMPGDIWGAELSIGARAEYTGLGLDLTITPRAEIKRIPAGGGAARAGAEFRLGPNLMDRDQRGTNTPAPSWFLFVGAENEALVWNVADRSALTGVALRDQATVGDLQAGVAWTMKTGGQISLGLVEREVEFKDPTGDSDVNRTDRFAAFSFTLHH